MRTVRIGLMAATVLAVLWCGWGLLERREAQRAWEAERERAANPPLSAEFNRIYGGSELKILQFYATGGGQYPGQRWSLCYGVLNAKSVRTDPPLPGLYPTLSKCVDVKPRTKTRYTLTAEDARGKTATASIVLPVRPGDAK
jgi:hypothetical protein